MVTYTRDYPKFSFSAAGIDLNKIKKIAGHCCGASAVALKQRLAKVRPAITASSSWILVIGTIQRRTNTSKKTL